MVITIATAADNTTPTISCSNTPIESNRMTVGQSRLRHFADRLADGLVAGFAVGFGRALMTAGLLSLMSAGMSAAMSVGPFGSVAVAQATGEGQEAIIRYNGLHHPEIGRDGMVVSQNRMASEVGAEILSQGGNAIDAAVATGFALAVTLPRAGNLGGGGFMLVYLAAEDRTIAIDYREMAPSGASRDMYLDANGDVDNQKARFSHLSAGVPGTVAGLLHAHERYGSMTLREVMQPAIRLAGEGIVVSFDMSNQLKRRYDRLASNAASRAAFYKAGGIPYEGGEILRQSDLARTLGEIAAHGREAFYGGEVADKIVAEMKSGGGLITLEDLANYRVIEREPVRGTYRGFEIVSMPPPSSGGVHVIQMLNILENFDLGAMGPASADSLHLMAEAMRSAFADRSKHLGDPDFYDVPLEWLMSKEYGRQIAASIPMDRARKSTDIAPGVPVHPESPDTTHFSIMDSAGNAVGNTFTLNFSYGSGIMVTGAGFLLNNEMDDFSSKPGVPNAFGLLGAEANAIEAGKRPLSSMTPTMVLRDGKPFLVTGGPGGSRIITSVFQSIVNTIDYGMNVADSLHIPRIHHQWYPDYIMIEPGISRDTLDILRQRGHEMGPDRIRGAVQQVMYLDGHFYGASDPRRPKSGAVAPVIGQVIATEPEAVAAE